jgi:hypothetical protein
VAVWFGSALSIDQRIAAISAVLTAAALFVAVLAAILAIMAVKLSTRRPILSVDFSAKKNPDDSSPTLNPGDILTINAFVSNDGQASATSARVTLLFFRVVVHSSEGWQKSGSAYSAEAMNIHPNGLVPIPLGGSLNVTVDAEKGGSIMWTVVADQESRAGFYLLGVNVGQATRLTPDLLADIVDGERLI